MAPVSPNSVAMVTAVSFQKKSLSYMLLVNPGNLLSINQESGALSLTRMVDYESGHNLHLAQVRASEADTSLSAVVEVRTCKATAILLCVALIQPPKHGCLYF